MEKKLETIGQESEGILKDSSRYVLAGGGKRLRSALVLFSASLASQPTAEDSILDVAASMELIHAATLVHDDIIDHAVLRRLKPPVNLQFGEDVAVLLGDFLYSKAFRMVASVGDQEITANLSCATQEMCEGELDQLKNRYRYDLSSEEYFSFIRRKTASLIAACSHAGARLAKLPAPQVHALSEFGLNLGLSYQIVDDLLDVIGSENKLGKTLRTDTGNGKMTLPMILLQSALPRSEKETCLAHFRSLNPDWNYIQTQIEKHQIVEKTRQYADQYLDKSLSFIQNFDRDARASLERLSRFVIERDY
ncbi:MAG: polyprenyl synthetase family protein [Elusimicrobia bacterium]|nr:polyprenyl synthetase family protein [Elusimicrobiota bacterium]